MTNDFWFLATVTLYVIGGLPSVLFATEELEKGAITFWHAVAWAGLWPMIIVFVLVLKMFDWKRK